jgi:hypothetical protein
MLALEYCLDLHTVILPALEYCPDLNTVCTRKCGHRMGSHHTGSNRTDSHNPGSNRMSSKGTGRYPGTHHSSGSNRMCSSSSSCSRMMTRSAYRGLKPSCCSSSSASSANRWPKEWLRLLWPRRCTGSESPCTRD